MPTTNTYRFMMAGTSNISIKEFKPAQAKLFIQRSVAKNCHLLLVVNVIPSEYSQATSRRQT